MAVAAVPTNRYINPHIDNATNPSALWGHYYSQFVFSLYQVYTLLML